MSYLCLQLDIAHYFNQCGSFVVHWRAVGSRATQLEVALSHPINCLLVGEAGFNCITKPKDFTKLAETLKISLFD